MMPISIDDSPGCLPGEGPEPTGDEAVDVWAQYFGCDVIAVRDIHGFDEVRVSWASFGHVADHYGLDDVTVRFTERRGRMTARWSGTYAALRPGSKRRETLCRVVCDHIIADGDEVTL